MKEQMVKSGIEFTVKDIELPPLRDYYDVNCVEGDVRFRLECFSMEFMCEEFSNRTAYELPPLQGNWGNVRRWVDNMWEAMYNPLWVRKYEAGNKRGWGYGIFDGHHRLRLFDALGANCIWGYVQNVKHFEKPVWVKKIAQANIRSPRRGVFRGPCTHCGEKNVKYRILSKPNHRLMGGKLVCGECGGEIPYPWAGVL